MNQHLRSILDFIQHDKSLSADEKNALSKSLKDADKDFALTAFKLDRTEKVKRTTAILLEETIEELEQKRKAVEAQNRELEIESSLERVRTIAMSMNKPDDMLFVCRMISDQLKQLGFKEIRNVQTVIIYEKKYEYLNYQYFTPYDKNSIEVVDYRLHPDVLEFTEKMLQSEDAYYTKKIEGEALKVWREYRKQTNQLLDPKLDEATSSHYYFYSIGAGALGVTTYAPLIEEQIELFKRFRNVFQLSYRRFIDIEKAEAQARQAQIELALERVRARAMAMQKSDELKELISTVFIELTKLDLVLTRCLIMIFDPKTNGSTWWMANSEDESNPMGLAVKYHKQPPYLAYIKAWQERKIKWQYVLEGKIKNEWDDYIFSESELSQLPDFVIVSMKAPDKVYLNVSFNNFGNLTLASLEPLSDKHFDIMLRVAKVFNQTYTRFLDLQKAEAQAREAMIEASLERVRSRTMAMHSSDGVSLAIATLFTELDRLDIENMRCGIAIINKNKTMEVWSVTNLDDGKTVKAAGTFNMDAHIVWQLFYNSWHSKSEFLHYYLSGKEKQLYIDTLNNTPNYLAQPILEMPDMDFQSYHFNEGAIWTFSMQPHSEEDQQVMKRFTAVFSQTFRRYLDLKKAEAQAREAQIELGLERVRAKVMAMQKSDDLAHSVAIIFEELDKLSMGMLRCGIGIINKDTRSVNVWAATTDKNVPLQISGDESMDRHPLLQGAFSAWLKQEDYSYELKGEDLSAYYKAQVSANFKLPDSQLLTADKSLRQYYFLSTFQAGGLFAFRDTPFPEEAKKVIKRFAGVLNLTYQRFADLQKAEAQAREAQIEAALERVRSRTMAMQRSNELQDTAMLLVQQVKILGVPSFACGFNIWDDDRNAATAWMAGEDRLQPPFKTSSLEDVFLHIYEAAQRGEQLFVAEQGGEELETHYRYMASIPIFREVMEKMAEAGLSVPTFQIIHCAFFSQGYLMFVSFNPVPEAHDIFKRFAKVFEQTYTRFLDLQKAEAQTREAQIEAALERVRSRTLAMHKTDELLDAAEHVSRELSALGITSMNVSYAFVDEEEKYASYYSINPVDGKIMPFPFVFPHTETDVMRYILSSWKKQEPFLMIELDEEATLKHQTWVGVHIQELITKSNSKISFSIEEFLALSPKKAVLYSFNFKKGYLFNIGAERLIPLQEELVLRFTKVFEQTYTRFLDLQKAEAQTREAIKASSLDRIRAEIASMRTAGDLQRITPSIWKELTILGLPFFRCGIFIISEKEEKIHSYLSTPDGQPLAVLHLDFTSSEVTRHIANYWRQQKVYTEHWNRKQFATWVQSLIGQGQIKAVNIYQAGDEPPESLSLQFVPFIQGMLYVGSAGAFSETQIKLVKALADAFSVAYARYEDFTKLEEAKGQVEKTLTELKATQSQLIQSEKMASLGELTAGIAHEIQNPLNFVNNFSEVSAEMIDEMEKEFVAGNQKEGVALVSDIKLNLGKILYHGKRADAIVKGMLQHTRRSTGKKESTDINALADEYLRLAYHGLMAKDKSFNATIKTDFDKSIGKINIIPQDIGRVILNLISNAFYAITEKKKQQPEGFDPRVSVSIKKMNDKVLISIKDNGNGISQKNADKIFQPFFTTKPAGQGTGLGLSLSYDIIKAHGGELQVKNKEGEGVEFRILLPV